MCFYQYPEIWAIDAIDPLVGPDGGESVADVAIRVSEAIMQMESEVQGFVLIYFFDLFRDLLHFCRRVPIVCGEASEVNKLGNIYICIFVFKREQAFIKYY